MSGAISLLLLRACIACAGTLLPFFKQYYIYIYIYIYRWKFPSSVARVFSRVKTVLYWLSERARFLKNDVQSGPVMCIIWR